MDELTKELIGRYVLDKGPTLNPNPDMGQETLSSH